MRLAALFLTLTAVCGAQIRQAVKIQGGQVAGVPGKDASIMVFKGLPFAAPPVGDLRWAEPKPVVPWQGVRKADAFGASCIQTIVDERKPWTYEFMTHTEISEDCLFLNVWTGAKSAGERRPVYVYIHGGGNTEGSGAVPVYDGEGLAKKGIVVVTVNYRLGVLGFFTHPELTKESQHKASGNYALLDLVAALRWVQANIAAFGGDAKRVTIGGQSAAASNTHSLTASPLAKGLFHRAIAESGSSVASNAMGPRTLADQEETGVKFAAAKGAKSLAELRKMSWKEVMAPVPSPGGTPAGAAASAFRFGAVVDGYVLAASVTDTFAQAKQNDVPTITGCNRHEGGATPHPTIAADEFQKQARQRYQEMAEAFLQLYPAASDAAARVAINESSWDQARVSMYLWAVNRGKTAKTKAYTYFWDHSLPGPDVETYGAFHTSEVPYAMNTLSMSNRTFTAEDHKVADMMSSYWANFIATGDPNGAGLPHWPAVSEQPAATMEIGDKTGAIPVAGSKEKLAFFERYFSRPRPPAAAR